MFTVEYHLMGKFHYQTISQSELKFWLKKLRDYKGFLGTVIYKSWKITRCSDNVVIAQWRLYAK